MQDAVTELARCSDNEILDHLRWHLEQGAMPTSIEAVPSSSVVIIRTSDGKQWQHEITHGWLIDYWQDARTIVARLPDLPRLAELPPGADAHFAEERKMQAGVINRWRDLAKKEANQSSQPTPLKRRG